MYSSFICLFLSATGDQGFDSAYKACLQSIEKLQCDYLDLYLIHWPGAANVKSDDPKNRELRIESWKALEKLQSEGMPLMLDVYLNKYTVPMVL